MDRFDVTLAKLDAMAEEAHWARIEHNLAKMLNNQTNIKKDMKMLTLRLERMEARFDLPYGRTDIDFNLSLPLKENDFIRMPGGEKMSHAAVMDVVGTNPALQLFEEMPVSVEPSKDMDFNLFSTNEKSMHGKSINFPFKAPVSRFNVPKKISTPADLNVQEAAQYEFGVAEHHKRATSITFKVRTKMIPSNGLVWRVHYSKEMLDRRLKKGEADAANHLFDEMLERNVGLCMTLWNDQSQVFDRGRLLHFSDSLPMDHILPAGSIHKYSPATKYLLEHGDNLKDDASSVIGLPALDISIAFLQGTPSSIFPPAASDYYQFDDLLNPEEKAVRRKVREILEKESAPIITTYWEKAEFPFHAIPKLVALSVTGGAIKGYGCPGLTITESAIATTEIAKVDACCSTFIFVHSSLAMLPFALCGSETQRQNYLPSLSRVHTIARWALTEPDYGCDASSLRTTSTMVSGGWILDGHDERTFSLSLLKRGIRQESDGHPDVLNTITHYLDVGLHQEWPEDWHQPYMLSKPRCKHPLISNMTDSTIFQASHVKFPETGMMTAGIRGDSTIAQNRFDTMPQRNLICGMHVCNRIDRGLYESVLGILLYWIVWREHFAKEMLDRCFQKWTVYLARQVFDEMCVRNGLALKQLLLGGTIVGCVLNSAEGPPASFGLLRTEVSSQDQLISGNMLLLSCFLS